MTGIDCMLPDKSGHFNGFGGRFVPEVLISALDQLEKEYLKAKNDSAFQKRTAVLSLKVMRPAHPFVPCPNLTRLLGGKLKIYLKREDLLHTGAHKINNTVGQALLALRMKGSPGDCRDRGRPARGGYGSSGGPLLI